MRALGLDSTDLPDRPVRTLPADSGELLPLRLSTAPGGVLRARWDAATSELDGVVVRRSVDEQLMEEVVLDGTATEHQFAGLPAATVQQVQVFAVTDLETRPYTVVSEGSEEHTSELQSLMRTSSAVFCLTQQNK